jgi:choline kinase
VIGLVMAAGAGRRLRPETDHLPKTLLPVDGDLTILDIALKNLAAAGLADVVVLVGYAATAVEVRVPDLERRHGVRLELVYNDRAEEWNNAYSLWLAREHFGRGVLLVNGDTVHPVSVERTLLDARAALLASGTDLASGSGPASGTGLASGSGGVDLILALDNVKKLADEEMKVVLDERGLMQRITKLMDPAQAHGEYIGATLIEPRAAHSLAAALEATWRRDPGLYYEDGFQELADRGGAVAVAPIGVVDWVEVDDHRDLRRAREIAARC